MLQERVLDLNDKMNSLLFYFKNDDKCITKSVNKDVFLDNLNGIQTEITSEVERLTDRLPVLEKSQSVPQIKRFGVNFKKNMVVHMALSYRVQRVIDIIKSEDNREIEIPQYVANYFENV